MNNNFLSDQWVAGFAINAIFYIVCKIFASIDTKFKAKDPRLSNIFFLSLTFTWLVFIILNCLYLYYSEHRLAPCITFLLLSALYALAVWRKLIQFFTLGLIGSDCKTIEGINYETSLKLCRSQLAFLGIGASKLTSSQNFIPALLRCKQDKPIKFLLLNPENETLVRAARRADKDPKKYHQKVLDSLKIIKGLKTERELDIQVRFYNEKPIFRMMFLDNSLCLCGGYTQIGIDNGSKLPQIHIVNKSDQYHATCFYSTLKLYYDDLWKKSEEWDFVKYI